jgi:hypothetical protein
MNAVRYATLSAVRQHRAIARVLFRRKPSRHAAALLRFAPGDPLAARLRYLRSLRIG